MTNSVPDRWLEYKAFGDVIKGTRILAFKVPLKDAIAKNLEPEQRFTTTVLLRAFPHLKYIVDLTNTCRYYDRQEFINAGVKYEKIAIPGRKVPPMDITKKFFKVMDDFTSTCGEGELIGVHCTHGVNRTGYLICRYLIQQLGWEIEYSLQAFGEARGYPVERGIYLAALKELQPGKKISVLTTRKPALIQTRRNDLIARSVFKNQAPGLMAPPPYTLARRGFANGGPYPPHQRYGIGGPPGYGPMPPPPGMPPMGPPPMGPPLYGPRPFRYGPPPLPMRSAMPPTPPGPGFPHPGFPPRMPGPPRMAPGPPRLPTGSNARLPPPKMPPPSPSASSRTVKHLQAQKKKQQIRNGIMERAINIRLRRNGPINRIMSKAHKEQDFTADTFEENLLTTSTAAYSRRQMKGRFIQTK